MRLIQRLQTTTSRDDNFVQVGFAIGMDWRPQLRTASQALDTFDFTFKCDDHAVQIFVTCICTLFGYTGTLISSERERAKTSGASLSKLRSSLIIEATS